MSPERDLKTTIHPKEKQTTVLKEEEPRSVEKKQSPFEKATAAAQLDLLRDLTKTR